MTTKHRAIELADYFGELFVESPDKKLYFEDAKDAANMLRTIPVLEAEIEGLEARAGDYMEGWEEGFTACKKEISAEIEALKAEANKWHQMYVERAVK